jgi:hypothetical protein
VEREPLQRDPDAQAGELPGSLVPRWLALLVQIQTIMTSTLKPSML